MELAARLSTEDIVTNLLSSNEVLRRNKDNFYMSTPNSLGDFLKNMPIEPETSEIQPTNELSRYTFIKSRWNID